METQTCPRRMSDFGPWERTEGIDNWTGRGLISQDGEASCSFCGSLHPDTFMAWVEGGGEVGPTDKRYKAYIKSPTTDAAPHGREAKFYYQHLSHEQKRRFVDLYNDQTMQIGYPGNFTAFPFFMVDVAKAP